MSCTRCSATLDVARHFIHDGRDRVHCGDALACERRIYRDASTVAARQAAAELVNRATYIDSLGRVHLVQVFAVLRSKAMLARIVETLDHRCPIGTVVELVSGELRPRALFDSRKKAMVQA